jgi:hypothetical protein
MHPSERNEDVPPLFTRTVDLRMTEHGEEVDTVVVALPSTERVPGVGWIYQHPDMGDMILVSVWPAGEVPEHLNTLTHDAPVGSTVLRLRRP